ncbi:MAG TPA: DinB family protein [Terriglobales bacterium]|nr:DinB family protein [Terriglobales bacterium]
MAIPTRLVLEPPAGFSSREVALFVAQLDDQSRRLIEDTRGLSPDALAWQPGPGLNTMGMLLAHVAYYEVFWSRFMLEGRTPPFEVRDVLGIDREEVGTPLPADGHPPAALAGRDIAFFHDLLARARTHTVEAARRFADADLGREVTRQRPDGSSSVLTPRWALYHMVEHEAGHYAQIQLLKHLQRTRAGGL